MTRKQIDDVLKKAEDCYCDLKKESDSRKQLFSFIIERCILQTKNATKDLSQFDLQAASTVARYSLEALITVRLCNKNGVIRVFNG